MPREEFTVRVTRQGEIILEMDGIPVRHVKDLISLLEERLGPARPAEAEDDGGAGKVGIDELLAREIGTDEEQTENNHRLRTEE